MAKLVLTMIVKNEAKIIERCIESSRPIIDGLCICDTGSTDDTIERIQAYAKKYNLPVRVNHHQWKNFGYNRTLSYKSVREFIHSMGWDEKHTYALLLDADMKLVFRDSFSTSMLSAPVYSLLQKDNELEYYNVRLIRLDQEVECIGSTHEYWSTCTPEPISRELLYIDDVGDGGSKGDKSVRDLKLLLNDLKDNPNNLRTIFYIGQTYMALGKYRLAIANYQKRIELAVLPCDEEAYYSMLQISLCYRELKEYDKFADQAQKAHQYDPSRVESLSYLAEHYIETKNYKGAFELAQKCYKTPIPKTPKLFLEPDRYQKLSLYQLCICSYYLRLEHLGLLYCEQWLRDYDEPSALDTVIPFYIHPIPFKPVGKPLPSPSDSYYPKNPTLFVFGDELMINIQVVNYTMDPLMRYQTPGYVETKNYLTKLELNGNKYHLGQLKLIPDSVDYSMSPIRGFEDTRYICSGNRTMATAVCWVDDNVVLNQPSMQLLTIDAGSANITERVRLIGPGGPERAEKNWLPLSLTDEYIDLWYSCHPVQIVRYEFETKKLVVHREYKLNGNYSTIRGSASLRLPSDYHMRPNNAEYLLLVHEVFNREVEHEGVKGYPRSYYHRWIWLDRDYRPIRFSFPFYFQNHGVEYTTTLVYYQGRLLSVVCTNDHVSQLIELDPEVILRMSLIVPEYTSC